MSNFLTTDLWNDFFDLNKTPSVHGLRADVIEGENDYEILANMPGYKKENIHLSLENGYLTITGENSYEKNETNEDENNAEKSVEKETKKYIRRERFYGTVSRNFYIGEGYTEEDIQASFEDGVLKVSFPKEVKKIENKKFIAIQ